MELHVTYKNGEAVSIKVNHCGFLEFDVEDGKATYAWSNASVTMNDIERVADEIYELPFIDKVAI